MRVLLADDERMLADTVAEGLRRLAMAVDVVYDGDSAVERLDVNRYDVAVLDRDMPGRTGDEVCRRIVGSGARAPLVGGPRVRRLDRCLCRRRQGLPRLACRVARRRLPLLLLTAGLGDLRPARCAARPHRTGVANPRVR